MIELLQTIAMICQVSVGSQYMTAVTAFKTQLICQKYYVECTKTKKLDQCILKFNVED